MGAGVTIATGALGATSGMLGMIGQRRRKKRAHERSKELMGIQHANQKELNVHGTELSKQLSMDLYNLQSPKAYMQQLKDAGLNPALIYGMGGQGGQTIATGGGGGTAGSGTSHAPMDIGSIVQASLAAAQARLLEAQTEKTKEETKTIAGPEREGIESDNKQKAFDYEFKKMLADDLKTITRADASMKSMSAEEQNLYWEMKKAIDFENGYVADDNNLAVRRYKAEFEKLANEIGMIKENISNAQKQGDILEAEKQIKAFEARLTEFGIHQNSIAAARIVTDLVGDIFGKKFLADVLKQNSKPVQEHKTTTTYNEKGKEVRRQTTDTNRYK